MKRPLSSIQSLIAKVFRRPSPVERHLARAREFFGMGELGESIASASEAIEFDHNACAAYFLRAEAKIRLSDFNGALFDLNKVVSLEPQNIEAFVLRGAVREGLFDLEGAIREYGRAIELAPDHSEAYYRRAAVQEKLECLQEALADYSKAIELASSDLVSLYIARGGVRDELGDTRGAMGDYAEAAYQRGMRKLQAQDFKGAVAEFTRTLEFNASHARAYLQRGLCKMGLADKTGAAQDYDAAVALDPALSAELSRN